MPQWYTRHRWLGLLVVVGLVAMLALAACNGDDDDDVAPTPTPDDNDVAPPPTDELVIGALVPFTGDLSDFGPAFRDAIQLAVDEINEAGGVLGNPVRVVEGDTGTSPAQGAEEARRLVDIEGVHAIVGAASSGVSLNVAESVTVPEGVLQISPASTSPALTEVPIFRTTISDAAQGVVLAQLAEEEGVEAVCNMFVNNAYGQGLSEIFADNFPGTVVAEVPHDEGQATYSSELAQCEGADTLAAIAYPESARVFLREAVELDIVPSFIFVDGTQSEAMFADLGWDIFDGIAGTAPGALDLATGQAFDDRWEAVYGARPHLPFLREAYDATYLVALAAEAAGTLDRAAIRDAVRDVSGPPGVEINPGPDGWAQAVEAIANGEEINYEGAAGPVDLDENGDVLIGAIEVWRINAAEETFDTEAIYRVDLTTGDITRID
jgi:branched-chain amino acid transport system substrate-binding protein